jgi:regulator of replication initiation timing
MSSQCFLCGSRQAGLIQDPGRDNDYVCADCLFKERDSQDNVIKILKRQISELKENVARLHQEKDLLAEYPEKNRKLVEENQALKYEILKLIREKMGMPSANNPMEEYGSPMFRDKDS